MAEREITLRFLAEPGEVNFGGKVHGGAVMRWIDQAGYSCAVNWSQRYCVTVYVGGIRFLKPIQIGQLVEVEARVIYTSMHIAVDVWARDLAHAERQRTTHCIIVFVAVDGSGKPVPVPAWEPVTEKDLSLRDYAQRLMHLREGIEKEMAKFHTT